MTGLPDTFAALADETRFAIVERLVATGACTAGELGDVAPISAPAISRHLKVLRKAGVIEQRVEGARRIYSANPAVFRTIADWTIEHQAFWDASLDRLERVLNAREDAHGDA